MVDKEVRRRDQWESFILEDYCKVGESFDLLDFKFQFVDSDLEEDEEYGKRNEKFL